MSYHDREIDWEKVASSGITFGIAQTTFGDKEDPNFLKNWKDMRQNGLKTSAYHTVLANQTGKSQADRIKEVLEHCEFSKEKDIIAISIEESGNENITSAKITDTLIEIISDLEESSFKNIVIGTGPYFWKHNVDFKKYEFSKYGLWISHFSGERFLRVPETWRSKGYVWWRYTYFGKVDGVRGSVSRNRGKAADHKERESL